MERIWDYMYSTAVVVSPGNFFGKESNGLETSSSHSMRVVSRENVCMMPHIISLYALTTEVLTTEGGKVKEVKERLGAVCVRSMAVSNTTTQSNLFCLFSFPPPLSARLKRPRL